MGPIEQTWLQDVPNYLMFTDAPGPNQVFMTDDTSYESHLAKAMNSFSYLFRYHSGYDWYINVDDDTYLNYNNLVKELKDYSTDKIFMLGSVNKGTCAYDFNLSYCSGGAGSVYNRKTLAVLAELDDSYKLTPYADANIGLFCRDKGIKLVHNDKFNGERIEKYSLSNEQIKSQITFHYVAGAQFFQLHNLINS